jgi:hypothetical protein
LQQPARAMRIAPMVLSVTVIRKVRLGCAFAQIATQTTTVIAARA